MHNHYLHNDFAAVIITFCPFASLSQRPHSHFIRVRTSKILLSHFQQGFGLAAC